MGNSKSKTNGIHDAPRHRRTDMGRSDSVSKYDEPRRERRHYQDAPPPAYSSSDVRYDRTEIKTTEVSQYAENPDLKSYAFSALKKYDTVVVLDDSGSMNEGLRSVNGSRWEQAQDALATLAQDAGKYDSDGIDIHFINHILNNPMDGRGLKTEQQVRELLKQVPKPQGLTPIGAKLDEILSAYMRELKSSTVPPKLLNVIVITDGAATDCDHLKAVIARTTRNLDDGFYPLRQIGIQFIQIGNGRGATKFLTELDDDLMNNKNPAYCATRDIVDTVICTSGGKFTAGLLLKILTGGIDRTVDGETAAQIANSSMRRADARKKMYY